MKKEIPKCNSCGQSMFEVAELAGDIQIIEPESWSRKLTDGRTESGYVNKVVGMRHPILYQCSKCKEVKID